MTLLISKGGARGTRLTSHRASEIISHYAIVLHASSSVLVFGRHINRLLGAACCSRWIEPHTTSRSSISDQWSVRWSNRNRADGWSAICIWWAPDGTMQHSKKKKQCQSGEESEQSTEPYRRCFWDVSEMKRCFSFHYLYNVPVLRIYY